MLARLLGLLGLESVITRLRRVAHDAEFKAKAAGVGVAFGLASATMALVAFIALLIAVFWFARQAIGDGWALVIVVVIPAAIAAVLAAMASSWIAKMNKPPPFIDAAASATRPPRPEPREAPAYSARPAGPIPPVAQPFELRKMLSESIASVFRAPPPTGTPVDGVVQGFVNRAVASSDDAVDLAAEVVTRGPRSAVFGILAGTVALGWFIARQPRA